MFYHQRTGKPVDELNSLIAGGDYWMTGEEAVAMGFADETYNENSDFKIAARIGDLTPTYRNIPKSLAELPSPEPEKPASISSHISAGNTSNQTTVTRGWFEWLVLGVLAFLLITKFSNFFKISIK